MLRKQIIMESLGSDELVLFGTLAMEPRGGCMLRISFTTGRPQGQKIDKNLPGEETS